MAPAPLLALPDAVLGEVLAWSCDFTDANSLLTTCKEARTLRSRGGPAAAALLLLRSHFRPSRHHLRPSAPRPDPADYEAALQAVGGPCQGGPTAVVHHVLRLLADQSLEVAPVYTAPPPLLQAMLYVAAAGNDAASLRTLITLPHPPSIHEADSRAFTDALAQGHLSAIKVLLEHGALSATEQQCTNGYALHNSAFSRAGQVPACTHFLPLLLEHCPPPALDRALKTTMSAACRSDNAAAADVVLQAAAAAGAVGSLNVPWRVRDAVVASRAALLRVLLRHCTLSAEQLTHLVNAAPQNTLRNEDAARAAAEAEVLQILDELR